MIVSTKAIVVAKLKYSDNDLIVKCYTQEKGIVTFMVKGGLSSKRGNIKPAYFQLLSLLSVEYDYKHNRDLQFFKTIHIEHHFQTLHSNILKSTVIMFLAETLNMALKEEEPNLDLFHYLESALIWFDKADSDTNFHHKFLIGLTKFLGISPDDSNNHLPFFDLEQGSFQQTKTGPYAISNEKLNLFISVLGMKFDTKNNKPMTAAQKQELLNMILLYFKLHLQGFKSPKSLAILNQVFG